MALIAWKKFKLKLLSPTVWAAGMFTIYTLTYIFTFNTMLSDISLKTVVVVLGFLSVTFIGELCATVLPCGNVGKKQVESVRKKSPILISKRITILITIIFLIVAITRFYNLLLFALKNGSGFSNIIEMLSVVRTAYVAANRSVVLGNFVFNQIVYVCEIATYIYVFVFMYNLMVHKIKNYYLLFPILPDLIIRVTSTSRSAFIILFLSVLIFYIFIMQKLGKNVFKIPIKLLLLFICFAVFFVWYGIARNSVNDISLIDYIQMYTCSAIYNLDNYLINGWGDNPYFGFYTLQGVYEFLGIEHSVSLGWDSFLVFSTHGIRSNLYTSLASTIQDYGIGGMLVIKFLESVIGTIILRKFYSSDLQSHTFYVSIFFAIAVIYCYLWGPIGNVFIGYYGSPDLMVRYLIYGFILVRFIVKPKFKINKSLDLHTMLYKKTSRSKINV